MQQDNNHIEDKLRQLENQQLPDLSNMDKHWQDMHQLLTAGTAQKNIQAKFFAGFNLRNFFLAAAAIALIIFATWYFNIFPSNTEKNPVAKNPVEVKAEQAFHNNLEKTASANASKHNASQLKIMQAHRNEKVNEGAAGNAVPYDSLALVQNAAVLTSDDDDSKANISSFYSRLQKPVQEFTINADKGGSITANEGSFFTIPPSAFTDQDGKIVSGTVKISVEEFYKYSDMIAANLTTTSGGKQLSTAGMIKITASLNGNSINLRNSKEISLLMPTDAYDPAMKLFTSESEAAIPAMYAVANRNLDWDLTGQQNGFPVYDGKTNFPDHLNQPYNVIKTGKKRIAKFALSKNSSLTTDEMEKILKEKFGHLYDEIKVKRESGSEKASNFFYRGTLEKENIIGDSTRLTLEQALVSKYIDKSESAYYAEKIKADSLLFIKRFIANKFLCSLSAEYKDPYQGIYTNTKEMSLDSLDKIYNDYNRKQTTYSFTIKKMGWINCDKFSHHSNVTNLVINLPADVNTGKFVSQVVFINTRSVLPGRTNNNQIGFQNIPADLGVYVVGLGERNGKMVSFMQKLKVGKSEVSINELQETTPEAFRKRIAELDMN